MFKIRTIAVFVAAGITAIIALFTLQGMLPKLALDDLEFVSNNDTNIKVLHHSRLGYIARYNMSVFDITRADILVEIIPENVKAVAKDVKHHQKRISIMGFNTFYLEALPTGTSPSNITVVLLHGMNFKSQTWVDLGTFSLLAAMGHKVIAFDLPGYGNTPGEKVPEDQRGKFLNEALKLLNIEMPVIVSPSMSGSFSLPYLFQFKGQMGGYVPVAPIFTEKFSDEEYKSINTPTLIIFGEYDEQLGELSTLNLRKLPNSQVQMLPKAKHPAYLDQPELFHKLLYNLLLKLKT